MKLIEQGIKKATAISERIKTTADLYGIEIFVNQEWNGGENDKILKLRLYDIDTHFKSTHLFTLSEAKMLKTSYCITMKKEFDFNVEKEKSRLQLSKT